MTHTDTIAAISTPRGVGGIAVIRISGEGAFECASRVFTLSSRISATDAAHSRAYYGHIVRDGAVIDDGIATFFRSPHSFTGEDTVEISCHGGVLITNEVLAAVLAAGARPAEAGEFTRRAFTAGKLSLSEAEALGDLIHAKTSAQLTLSSPDARTNLGDEVYGICRLLTSLIARVNVNVDYPEEDLADISDAELLVECETVSSRLHALSATYKTGRAVIEGVDAVICGRPNAGKSTLYNLFTGENTAIVTDIAGTTRDTLTTDVSAGAVLLHLSDTAGIRDTDDVIEAIGVQRARDRISSAELIITVHDATIQPDEEDETILSSVIPTVPRIAVINKTDDENAVYAGDYSLLAEKYGAHAVTAALVNGEGFDAIKAQIEKIFTDGELRLGHDAVIMNARQASEASRARDAVDSAADALRRGFPSEIAVCELEEALSALSRLGGRDVNDEVLAEIFSKFCVGK